MLSEHLSSYGVLGYLYTSITFTLSGLELDKYEDIDKDYLSFRVCNCTENINLNSELIHYLDTISKHELNNLLIFYRDTVDFELRLSPSLELHMDTFSLSATGLELM